MHPPYGKEVEVDNKKKLSVAARLQVGSRQRRFSLSPASRARDTYVSQGRLPAPTNCADKTSSLRVSGRPLSL